MNILVINCGSSSIKADVIDHEDGRRVARMRVERVGTPDCLIRFDDDEPKPAKGDDHRSVLSAALPSLVDRLGRSVLAGVGHRVVHGGERFKEPTLIDEDVIAAIRQLVPLAPLHNPANLAGIEVALVLLGDIPHVAVFDTAFHTTLPNRAKRYAIDRELADAHGVRRYGFHGTSHAYVASRAAAFLNASVGDLRLITCHLGNGASVCAIEYGRSIETSMGMTPLEGLMMGTRSGDIDPGALIHLMRSANLDVDGIDELLNKRSGLAGLSGVGNDMRDIEERAAAGDERCRSSLQVYAHRVRKYIGAYAAVLGGVDAVVFTGGIGENAVAMRHRICQRLEVFGARIDEDKNREVALSEQIPVVQFSTDTSRAHLLAVATDEQHAIAQRSAAIVGGRHRVSGARSIPVAISARHIHLTTEAVAKLFGEGHELTPLKELSQPGQFACAERLNVVGPKRTIESVRVLGPTRRANQVEVSRTDEFFLGIDAPVRDSGDVSGSAGITLLGPAGELTLSEGVICARRHIHMTPEDAEHFGVVDKDVVEVAIDSNGRSLTFGDVLIRVSPKYALEMHIDTDEANAAELNRGAEGLLMATTGVAGLQRKSVRNHRA